MDPPRSAPLARIGRFAARRPRLILAVWVIAVAMLAIRGIGIEERLTPADVYLDGTASSRANEIAIDAFGDEDALIVMLRGPRGEVERQGRRLEARLDALPGARVLSPWQAGGVIKGLRPSPRVAALLVSVRHDASERNVTAVLPPVREAVETHVRSPVRVDISGSPQIVSSFRSAAEDATEAGEKIAIPAMLLILLLVFRSVLAAAIPVAIGGAVVVAGRGALDLLEVAMPLEAFAASVLAMMGLALGVDYSLLVVSRFREELGKAGAVSDAVQRTVAATGRTALSAGVGLVLTMLIAIPLLPGPAIGSIAAGVIVASVLSVLSALTVVPAVLALLGENVDRWSLPTRKRSEGGMARLSRRMVRRPALVTLPVVFLLLLGTGYAFALDTGLITAGLLPPEDDGRRQQEAVERELGAGWSVPFEIIVNGRDRPVTTPSRMRALAVFERQVAADPAVDTTAGFARLERETRPLGGLARRVNESEHGLARLEGALGRARSGIGALGDGATALHSATGETTRGAGNLEGGIDAAASGSTRLVDGIARARSGGQRLATGARRTSRGTGRLKHEVSEARANAGSVSSDAQVLENAMRSGVDEAAALREPVGNTERLLLAAWRSLQRMTAGRSDPEFQVALDAVASASAALTGAPPTGGDSLAPEQDGVAGGINDVEGQLSLGLYLAERMKLEGRRTQRRIDQLVRGTERLDRGAEALASGSAQVSGGLDRLWHSGVRLPSGLDELSDGSARLVGGLGQVEKGAGQLADGLSGAGLGGGLSQLEAGVGRQRRDSGAGELRKASPGLERSGYLYLAGIDGAPPAKRSQAAFVVSVDRGGLAARMQVIPRGGPLSETTRGLRDRLTRYSEDLASRTGAEVVVGGPTAAVLDYDRALRDAMPLAILLLSFVTVVTLLPTVRSLTLPIVSALLNVITVGAALGALALLFDSSFLGGPGYVDTASVSGLIMVIFGLSIDYEVFVFARMREEYDRSGSLELAITDGLRHTARLITGAAVIMIAVFVAFSFSSFASIRNFGVGLAIAVFLDTFVIRLIVLPALMRAMGRWCWWMPAWLERLLPDRKRDVAAAQA
jgi:putative drug exporter of the RND superfamily